MRILVFGDSIVRGSMDTEYGGWVSRLSAWCMQKTLDEKELISVFNLGIAGETSEELSKRIKDEFPLRIIDDQKTVVIIQTGINDSKVWINESRNETNFEDFQSAYTRIVNYALNKNCSVFCLGLTQVNETNTDPIPPRNRISFRNVEIEKYDNLINQISKENEVNYIPLDELVTKKYLVSDGIHPNAEGHRLIFERVKSVLEKEDLI